MAIIKCKMCGGSLEIVQGSTTATCEYCGCMQTVPKADDEKKLTLFGRANRLRAACEFDKAAGIYESIVANFPEEAEAYWGLVLCRYGIEYVDDPATGKKIPTCHRSSFDSVMSDSDYEQTLENADPYSRRVYREEAKQIEQLRKDIIAASANEEPYDIFICYKETAPDGQRTLDSVLAQDIYDALTDKGYRVFFARITLEDKLGAEYEPVIFAALHSAKIMLAVGTDYEYFNAVWVKNEWGRYLKLMEKDREKHLIPCYKGIDAYDMPPEFAKLQAQDLGKVGATQDLLRGVEKILPRKAETVKETVVVQQAAAPVAGVDSLLKRVFMFLEDGDWQSADEYCEKVLDIDPECAQAYLGKLMAELKVKKQDDLKKLETPFDGNVYYQKAIRFGDENLKNTLSEYVRYINNINNSIEVIAQRKAVRNKKMMKIAISVGAVLAVFFVLLFAVIIPANNYDQAATLEAEGETASAAIAFYKAGVYNGARQRSFALWDQIAQRKTFDAGGFHTVGLKTDGTVVAAGNNESGQCDVSGWTDIIAISAGASHTVGLKADGTVVAVGDNSHEQCSVSGWTDIVAISAGDNITAGLKADGTVVITGHWLGRKKEVSEWTDIISISLGNEHITALKTDGTVIAAGENHSGQCDVGAWTGIDRIFAGSNQTVAIKTDGSIVATEYFWTTKSNVKAVYISDYHEVGLKTDGTVVAIGIVEDGQCDVGNWRDIVAVSAGLYYTVGLRSDGSVVATGNNNFGQCNVTGWTNIKIPNK